MFEWGRKRVLGRWPWKPRSWSGTYKRCHSTMARSTAFFRCSDWYFAADAALALDEVIRVLGPAGRALVSVWVPAGPIDAMLSTFRRALATATGNSPARFAWHDAPAVGALAARHGAQVQIHEGQLRVTAASPEAYLEANERHGITR